VALTAALRTKRERSEKDGQQLTADRVWIDGRDPFSAGASTAISNRSTRCQISKAKITGANAAALQRHAIDLTFNGKQGIATFD